jgi:hypothetical protein
MELCLNDDSKRLILTPLRLSVVGRAYPSALLAVGATTGY